MLRSTSWRGALALVLSGMAVWPSASAFAQHRPYVSMHDLASVYRAAQFQLEFRALMAQADRRVAPRPVERFATRADTLGPWILQQAFDYAGSSASTLPPGHVSSWRVIPQEERLAQQKAFGDRKWAFLGTNYFTLLDTTRTMEIRARMEHRFGAPTRTVVEIDYRKNLLPEDYIQFEYWFVLNDSIPLMVTDVNGPFDRGVIVATDHSIRDDLYALRQFFLGGMMREEPFAVYTDYYYNSVTDQWYRVGFDGQVFFNRPIRAPNLSAGRPQPISSPDTPRQDNR